MSFAQWEGYFIQSLSRAHQRAVCILTGNGQTNYAAAGNRIGIIDGFLISNEYLQAELGGGCQHYRDGYGKITDLTPE